MIRALRECVILGVKTPIEFMIDIMASQQFQAGDIHSCFIDDHFGAWVPEASAARLAVMGFVAAEMVLPAVEATAVVSSEPTAWRSPWQTLGAWDMTR
jgi:acetyl-CoA carboxylase biotin carboxylase subunit